MYPYSSNRSHEFWEIHDTIQSKEKEKHEKLNTHFHTIVG